MLYFKVSYHRLLIFSVGLLIAIICRAMAMPDTDSDVKNLTILSDTNPRLLTDGTLYTDLQLSPPDEDYLELVSTKTINDSVGMATKSNQLDSIVNNTGNLPPYPPYDPSPTRQQ
ncbi:MAG TPA: hypothetical protein P5067_11620, partial [Candidatus Marinimicrobia bacterium]|nr:hypothetical protein [Candidatus Neomarinimicrobiota bacterium]